MQNGDDTLAYTQTGEMVIPLAVQQANPALVAAAKMTMSQMGVDPNRFVVGSPSGQYNPATGAQEFYLTWEDIKKYAEKGYEKAKEYGDKAAEYGTKALDYVANTRTGQSLATGVITAGAAKLGGSSNTQALASGAAAGLGYAAGDAIGDVFSSSPSTPNVKSSSMKDAAIAAGSSFSNAGLIGASTAGKLAYDFTNKRPEPTPMPEAPKPEDPNLPPMTTPPVSLPGIDDNDQPNVSATLPQDLPVAPMAPTLPQMASGVQYKRKVKDKDTGQFSYVNVDENDAASFSRALRNRGRRQGFGNSPRIVIG
jgi:hypothetical protein